MRDGLNIFSRHARIQFQALIIDYITILVPVLLNWETIDFNQLIIDYNLSF